MSMVRGLSKYSTRRRVGGRGDPGAAAAAPTNDAATRATAQRRFLRPGAIFFSPCIARDNFARGSDGKVLAVTSTRTPFPRGVLCIRKPVKLQVYSCKITSVRDFWASCILRACYSPVTALLQPRYSPVYSSYSFDILFTRYGFYSLFTTECPRFCFTLYAPAHGTHRHCARFRTSR